MKAEVVFYCQSLSVGYQKSLASNLSFSLTTGKIALIRGSNGSGKTTFIKTILGDIESLGGEYKWGVEPNEISYLPQITNSNSNFSYNIEEILDLYEVDKKFREKISPLLLKKRWVDASGGEKQKVMLFTRISSETRVLILDEPFNHLDKESIQTLKELIQDLIQNKEKPLAIILVSHIEIDFLNNILEKVEL